MNWLRWRAAPGKLQVKPRRSIFWFGLPARVVPLPLLLTVPAWLAAIALSGPSDSCPPWFPKAEPLPPPQGEVIRNNFISGGPDCGIELWYAERVKVLHNPIWRPKQNWGRGIRVGTGTAPTEIMNNLVHGEIRFDGGDAQAHHNLAGQLEGYFVDPPSGNLALTRNATGAIGQGVPRPEVTEDIRGRPRSSRPDLGAWETDDELKSE